MSVFVRLGFMQRVAVFIDHSNVHYNLRSADWKSSVKMYNPAQLAKRLAGDRELIKTMFYCSAPPPTLQISNPRSYELQEQYLTAVSKLSGVEIRFANLILQADGKYHEKNLDTQMTTNILMMAFRNEYDTAIILSNDGDFADAVKGIRELGKRAEVGYFRGSLSFNLRQSADLIRRLRPSHFVKLKL